MNPATFLDTWLHVLDPMRAEARVRLHQAGGVLHGRLAGPRSRFTTTIEIAYPFRPLSSPGEFAAIVPEPSLWSPAKPFIYEGPVEWVEPNGAAEKAWLRLCLRSVTVGSKGFVLNGQALKLHGKDLVAIAAESELLELRRQGFNALLLSTVQPETSEWADRLGFLLMRREKPGDNGEEILHCLLPERPGSGKLELPGVTHHSDGTFDLG